MIIAGKLTTSVGSVVQWATITFDPAVGPSISFTTDKDGNYSYEVPAGTYRVFTKGKYDINRKLLGENVVVAPSGTTSLESLLDRGVPSYTVATLPDPASLPVGSVVSVDGHAAIVSGGQIKYASPFRTTWNARPSPSAILPGAELQVTDYGNRKWISDGTNWSPAQGVVILYDLFGLNDGAGHIAQISGATSGSFAIPGGLKIPGGMIHSGTKISAQVEITKVGSNGTAAATVTLGTLNSASDSSIVGQNMSIATGMQALISCSARFGSSATKFNTRDYVGEGITQASIANVMKDRTSNINTDANMWVNININSANAGDVFNLIGVQVKLEA